MHVKQQPSFKNEKNICKNITPSNMLKYVHVKLWATSIIGLKKPGKLLQDWYSPHYNSECQAANQNASFIGRKPVIANQFNHGLTILNRTTLWGVSFSPFWWRVDQTKVNSVNFSRTLDSMVYDRSRSIYTH